MKKRVGILGGGQLGRMLALSGYPFGIEFRVYDNTSEAPAGQLAELVVGDFSDCRALERFASGLDLVTYEFENVPVDSVQFLQTILPVSPGVEALRISQDRLLEKNLFNKLQIPSPRSVAIDDRETLLRAASDLGFPVVLKTRRLGYDGKGQSIVRNEVELCAAWETLGKQGLLLEEHIAFDRELSIIAVCGRHETMFYPLVENEHDAGILRLSRAPAARVSAELENKARAYATRILDELGYKGVLTVEFFQRGSELLANEMAPRVHNSGHWTIEGAATSQFENHLRAILDLPLGDGRARGHAAVLNIIGKIPDRAQILAIPHAHLHLYGKAPVPGRKLGHIAFSHDDRAEVDRALAILRPLLG